MKISFEPIVHMGLSIVKDSVLSLAWDDVNSDTRVVSVALRVLGCGLYCVAVLQAVDCVTDLFFNPYALRRDLVLLGVTVAAAQIFINIGQNLSDEVSATPANQVVFPSLWGIICMGYR